MTVAPKEKVVRDMSHTRHEVCQRGHLMTDDNVYVRPDGQGRMCRVCKNLRNEARIARFVNPTGWELAEQAALQRRAA
jgi:hypothetical protein